MDNPIVSKRGSQTIRVIRNAAGVTLFVQGKRWSSRQSVSIFEECIEPLCDALMEAIGQKKETNDEPEDNRPT